MRFVHITTIAAMVTALASATPVPSIIDYTQTPDDAFPDLRQKGQDIFDACIMRYLRHPFNKPEDLVSGSGKHYHDFCVSEVARLLGPVTGLERARELKEKADAERDRIAADQDGTQPGAAPPGTEPTQKPAENKQSGILNPFKLDGLKNAFRRLQTEKPVGSSPAPLGGWAPPRLRPVW